MSTSLEATNFSLLGPLEDSALTLSLTRLRPRNPPRGQTSGERFSLLFTHGTSFHKETWIPSVENLFELQAQSVGTAATVVEAWLMDVQNHGRAAVLNENKLLTNLEGINTLTRKSGSYLAAYELARAIEVVFKSGLFAGTSVVGVAHSASAFGKLRHSRMIIVEPTMMTREVFTKINKNGRVWEMLYEMTKTRKDIWSSRKAAREWLSTRSPWDTWTPRCLDLFVEYALRDLPTSTYPDRKEGVTLCCTREQEAATYTYGGDDGFAAIDNLAEHSKLIPVHLIYGENANLVPGIARKAFLKSKQARDIASITTIPDVGHMVVEEDPTNLAVAVWNILRSDVPHRSRL
ncbi:alpha/beta-hydrolase [Lentinus tigrinus ALCF2SS1-7]|uniref:Alpha/beta-hydrolase n=1 Tax=Lentinus tigrinus ALCF2SS1-6 TaxID=1328759 RepID=A0A5C2SKM3_9APHY|nr:alpha/beta-hydrolase [Lentinus tigrinus ALCF2SS1-6]RPD76379.1 alpha/beta-hydrolase [Lentinus tigrinus ALCF2SS1-7]